MTNDAQETRMQVRVALQDDGIHLSIPNHRCLSGDQTVTIRRDGFDPKFLDTVTDEDAVKKAVSTVMSDKHPFVHRADIKSFDMHALLPPKEEDANKLLLLRNIVESLEALGYEVRVHDQRRNRLAAAS